jgi:hypothetical protein
MQPFWPTNRSEMGVDSCYLSKGKTVEKVRANLMAAVKASAPGHHVLMQNAWAR